MPTVITAKARPLQNYRQSRAGERFSGRKSIQKGPGRRFPPLSGGNVRRTKGESQTHSLKPPSIVKREVLQRSCGSRKLGGGMRKSVWRRRADSNRRIEVLQTPALGHLATSPLKLRVYFRLTSPTMFGAESGTRTHTLFRALRPQRSLSTNFSIPAQLSFTTHSSPN